MNRNSQRHSVGRALRPLLWAWAALLVACGSGCVILPVPHGPNRFDAAVGGPGSSAPVQVGVSDKARVLSVLGPPIYPAPMDSPAPGWSWRYAKGTTVAYAVFLWPFIHGGPIQPVDREDRLAIWFGPEGKVRRYATWSSGGVFLSQRDPRPPDVAAEDAEEMASRPTFHDPASRSRGTRPTTLPR